jgi:hypothetical protein
MMPFDSGVISYKKVSVLTLMLLTPSQLLLHQDFWDLRSLLHHIQAARIERDHSGFLRRNIV